MPADIHCSVVHRSALPIALALLQSDTSGRGQVSSHATKLGSRRQNSMVDEAANRTTLCPVWMENEMCGLRARLECLQNGY